MTFGFKKGEDLFLRDVRVVVEDIGNRREHTKVGFRIKEELLQGENDMLKNMSEIRKLDRARLPYLSKIEKRKLFAKV